MNNRISQSRRTAVEIDSPEVTVCAEAMAVLRDLLASGQTHPCGQSDYRLAEAGAALRALERAEVPGRIVLLM